MVTTDIASMNHDVKLGSGLCVRFGKTSNINLNYHNWEEALKTCWQRFVSLDQDDSYIEQYGLRMK